MVTPGRSVPLLQSTFGPYVFAAAHSELHDGELQPLRGSTYNITVRLQIAGGNWRPQHAATVAMSVNKLIAPLRDRTLIAEHPVAGRCLADERQVTVKAGLQHYSLPRAHVTLLPIENTTIDLLAGYLLEQLTHELAEIAGLVQIELTLAEPPATAITVSAHVEPSAAEATS